MINHLASGWVSRQIPYTDLHRYTRIYTNTRPVYENTRASIHEYAAGIREYTENIRRIYEYTENIRIYGEYTNIRRIRDNTRPVRGDTRADTRQYARIRKDSHKVSNDLPLYIRVWERLGHPCVTHLGCVTLCYTLCYTVLHTLGV